MKIERGVMVMKGDRAWGVTYEDGRSTSYGWMAPEDAPIHDPRYVKRPTDVTYPDSHHEPELASAQLVAVERTTTVQAIEQAKP